MAAIEGEHRASHARGGRRAWYSEWIDAPGDPEIEPEYEAVECSIGHGFRFLTRAGRLTIENREVVLRDEDGAVIDRAPATRVTAMETPWYSFGTTIGVTLEAETYKVDPRAAGILMVFRLRDVRAKVREFHVALAQARKESPP